MDIPRLKLPLDTLADQARIECVPISPDADAQQMRWTDWSQLLTTPKQTFRGNSTYGFQQQTRRKASY